MSFPLKTDRKRKHCLRAAVLNFLVLLLPETGGSTLKKVGNIIASHDKIDDLIADLPEIVRADEIRDAVSLMSRIEHKKVAYRLSECLWNSRFDILQYICNCT